MSISTVFTNAVAREPRFSPVAFAAAGGRGGGGGGGGGRGSRQLQGRSGQARKSFGTKTKTRRPRQPSRVAIVDEPCRLSPPKEGAAVPKLIVYDLDDTIWFPELYMMCGAPWERDELGRVTDVSGEEIRIYPAARESIKMILQHEAFAETLLAVASRTNRGRWACEAMELLTVDAAGKTTLRQAVGDLSEIFPGSKKAHFEKLRAKTKVAYHEMCFFDNEQVNVSEVGQLGVTSIFCPGGMSQGAWEQGLETYAKNARMRSADKSSKR